MCHEAGHCQRSGVPDLSTLEKSHLVTYPSSLSLIIGQMTIQTSSVPKQMTPTDRECTSMENLNHTKDLQSQDCQTFEEDQHDER